MEPKQILMLSVLIVISIIGTGVILNVLRNLDKEKNGDNGESGGH